MEGDIYGCTYRRVNESNSRKGNPILAGEGRNLRSLIVALLEPHPIDDSAEGRVEEDACVTERILWEHVSIKLMSDI